MVLSELSAGQELRYVLSGVAVGFVWLALWYLGEERGVWNSMGVYLLLLAPLSTGLIVGVLLDGTAKRVVLHGGFAGLVLLVATLVGGVVVTVIQQPSGVSTIDADIEGPVGWLGFFAIWGLFATPQYLAYTAGAALLGHVIA